MVLISAGTADSLTEVAQGLMKPDAGISGRPDGGSRYLIGARKMAPLVMQADW